jgi:DNA-binding response OmpR family regulator
MASAPHILVVDDDICSRALLRINLELDGFAVTCASDAPRGLFKLAGGGFDLVLLDLGMPGMPGVEVLSRIRDLRGPPVIVVSGLDSDDSRLRCLGLGADDYLVKPISPASLTERIGAVLDRRALQAQLAKAGTRPAPSLRIDVPSRSVWVGDTAVVLTSNEFDLLALLAGSPGRTFSSPDLLRRLSEGSDGVVSTSVTDLVERLRHKIEPDPSSPVWVRTVGSLGYRLERPNFVRAASLAVTEPSLSLRCSIEV